MKISAVNYSNINKTGNNPYKPNKSVQTADVRSCSGSSKNELPSAYYPPVNFNGKQRKYSSSKTRLKEIPSKFYITRFQDIPCPACGKKMLRFADFKEFCGKIDVAEPDEYINILNEYTKYMRPIELSAFEDIKKASKKARTKDLRTIVELLRDTKLKELQAVQTEKAKAMLELVQTFPEDEKEILSGKITELINLINKNKAETPFRRKIMLDKISQTEIKDPARKDLLLYLAKEFPTSNDMNSAWIVKYSGMNKNNEPWSSKDIAKRLLEFSVPNTDHIVAYSRERNNDDITNYMAMHQGCNCHKSDKSFIDWYNEDPELRQQSINDYFESVDKLISSRKLRKKKYKNYVAYATNTIKKATDDKIAVEVKKQ